MRNPNRIIDSISTKKQQMSIINYNSYNNVDIQFEDGTIVKNKNYYDFIKGKINNPNFPIVYDKGFIGQGTYSSTIDKKTNSVYTRWRNMMARCYSKKYHLKYPTYKNCSVCDEWLNFQNFTKWFNENYIEGYELDKDILIKGNKLYSPQTCCFVPKEINYLFVKNDKFREELPIGVTYNKNKNYFISSITKNNRSVQLGIFKNSLDAFNKYKYEKELYIKETANKFKNLISKNTYDSLYNYKVELND